MAALLVALALHPQKARLPSCQCTRAGSTGGVSSFHCLLLQAYPRAAPGEARISVHPVPVRKRSIGFKAEEVPCWVRLEHNQELWLQRRIRLPLPLSLSPHPDPDLSPSLSLYLYLYLYL